MWTVAGEVSHWLADGRRVVLARVVSFSGLGGRRAGETLALADGGERVGSLLGGSADLAVESAADRVGPGTSAEIVEVTVGDPEAIASGLACGGVARVLLQEAASVPAAFWEGLLDRRPAVLATTLGAGGAAPVAVVGDVVAGRELSPAERQEAVLATARRLLAAGREAQTTVEHEAGDVLVEAFVPTTRVVVLGEPGGLTSALARQSQLLGWELLVTWDGDAASEEVRALGPADAVVVLSHDHGAATPVLVSALARGVFAGALGSRHTQQARREHLTAAGVAEAEVARLHCPVGLDLGARAPEETALAICAEILAVRSGRDASSLSAGEGPVNG